MCIYNGYIYIYWDALADLLILVGVQGTSWSFRV